MSNEYKAIDIAAEFIRLGIENNNKLTHMQVQKLVYIANGYSLAVLDEQLFDDKITAWKYGPVIRNVYDALRKNGGNLITTTPTAKSIDNDLFTTIIQIVFNKYGGVSAWKLSALTHQTGTPWHDTWNSLPFGVITPDAIREYYRQFLNLNDKG